jgi:CDGSH-type Zn-finger protein
MIGDAAIPGGSDAEPPDRLGDGPYTFVARAGIKYAYCRCQQSECFPLCDGTHRQIGDGTEVKPIKVTPVATTSLAWCACGRSATKPDCDGTHCS